MMLGEESGSKSVRQWVMEGNSKYGIFGCYELGLFVSRFVHNLNII